MPIERTNEGERPCQIGAIRKRQSKPQVKPFLPLPLQTPCPMPHAHFGSKASFLRCDLQTLNYSRSYRKRRRKKRKESFAQRPNERTNWRTKLSIDQWKYSHSGDRQPRRGREGERERTGQTRTSCTFCANTFSRGCAGHQPKFHATFWKPLVLAA